MKNTFILSVILLFCSFANAQEGEILYVDFEPDSTQHFTYWEKLFLDLDQDGVSEWCYDATPGYGHNLELRLRSVNYNDPDYEVTYVHNLYPDMLYQFHYGDTLSHFYYEVPLDAQYAWGEEHHWTGNTHHPEDHYFEPHYLGVRKRVGEGEWCYGWIEASVYIHTWAVYDANYQSIDLTVYRAAYCTVPNYPLRVGQTDFNWTDTGDPEANTFATIHPNPTNDSFTIRGKNISQVRVYNAVGQIITAVQTDSDDFTLDISGQPAGVYFVNITDKEGKQCVKKMVKTN